MMLLNIKREISDQVYIRLHYKHALGFADVSCLRKPLMIPNFILRQTRFI